MCIRDRPYSDQYNVDINLSGDYYYMMPNMASSVTGDDLNLRLAMYYACLLYTSTAGAHPLTIWWWKAGLMELSMEMLLP